MPEHVPILIPSTYPTARYVCRVCRTSANEPVDWPCSRNLKETVGRDDEGWLQLPCGSLFADVDEAARDHVPYCGICVGNALGAQSDGT